MTLDLAGVGAGPANLCVAALADGLPGVRCRFFDRQPVQRWHPGLMLPGSVLQVSHLKDLVTMVDPTSPYTFLNFLARTGRLYRFASLPRQVITRREYESYLRWVAGTLPQVRFGCAVEEVTFTGDAFRLATARGPYTATHLSVGTGPVPRVPEPVAGMLGPTLLHSADFGYLPATSVRGRRVAVVGGGQSGAEVVEHLLGLAGDAAPRELTWVNRRHGFQPLDDSPFTNEWFHPDYVRYFHGLAPARRKELLGAQQLASDGISADLLERVYRRMYENDFVDEHRVPCAVLPGRELHRVASTVDGWRLDLAQCDTGAPETLRADTVVLATGYEFRLPEFLRPLADRIPVASDGQLALDADYSVPWDGPAGNKLFFLNAGRHSHGIADPNLSLASWRAATVLSSIADTPWDAGATTSTSRWASTVPHETVPHETLPYEPAPHRTESADR
ncbi:lysine N(6)-hydroxylase/L-ornithine N(5)-oxygenase family protein [Virgisporangium aurantiacum]